MTAVTLHDLQVSVQDKTAFSTLADYAHIGQTFLELISRTQPTRIISPTHNNYIFYQYDQTTGYKITRPLNTALFIESSHEFGLAFARFMAFLADVRQFQHTITGRKSAQAYIAANEINKVVYTIQQAIGSIGDSFGNPNQARKRIGQLFETLIKLIIQEVGLECEPRTIKIPIPGYPDHIMPYELDLVFSRNKAVVTAESGLIDLTEIVGSVKTTSKDRIDKIFLDKFLLTKLLGREVPVVAIFLHDVQRAIKGKSIFGINSTFKSNHFLGYTVALNSLDGVYYVDPRPEMIANQRLREQIADFQTFLVQDLWRLSG